MSTYGQDTRMFKVIEMGGDLFFQAVDPLDFNTPAKDDLTLPVEFAEKMGVTVQKDDEVKISVHVFRRTVQVQSTTEDIKEG